MSDLSSLPPNAVPLNVPDFVGYPLEPGLAAWSRDEQTLELRWADGFSAAFHFIWLRDYCACGACINPVTREQVFEVDAVPLDIAPRSVEISPDGGLLIQWDFDDHVSHFHPGWLRANCYSETDRAEPKRRRTTWGGDFELPDFEAAAVLGDDGALRDWLSALYEYGAARLKNLALEEGMVGRVAARISFMRETNFGTLFDVRSLARTNTNANTSLELPPHTDLPTREQEPGLQFLHCFSNEAEGGRSVLVDGFRLAEVLRRLEPDCFEVLSRTALDWRNTDRNSDYRCKAPVIGLDADGDLWEIRFGNFLKGPIFAAADRIPEIYAAYRRFMVESKNHEHQIRYMMAPGDMIAFENRRILHGRDAFDPETGARRLQGCYVDRDELLSRLRVLERPAGS